MPKLKTKKSADKRFRITAKKKILRRSQMAGHLKTKKSKSQIRRHKVRAQVSIADRKRIIKLLPYS